MNRQTSLRSIIIILIISVGVLTPLALTVFPPTTFAQYNTCPYPGARGCSAPSSSTCYQNPYAPSSCYQQSTYYQAPYCAKEISKTISPYQIDYGDNATVTIEVANEGTGPCSPVYGQPTVDDEVPSGMAPVESSLTITPNDGWSVDCWPGSNNCADVGLAFDGVMYPGYFVMITFQVQITAPSGTLQNCALVEYADGIDNIPNEDCATVTVVPYVPPPECVPDLTKMMSPDHVTAGSTANIMITLTNIGTGTCPISVSPFMGDAFLEMTPVQSSLTITPAAGWRAVWLTNSGGVEFYFANTMPVGYTVTFTFQVKFTSAAAQFTTIVNCAEAGWSSGGAVPGSGVVMGCATVTVTPPP